MPIEPSEIELLLKHYFPAHCDKYRERVLDELKGLILPVVKELEGKLTDAVQESYDAQNELYGEQQYAQELRDQIEELEGDKEWQNMVDMFWKRCQQT